jgi:hypothetical protein
MIWDIKTQCIFHRHIILLCRKIIFCIGQFVGQPAPGGGGTPAQGAGGICLKFGFEKYFVSTLSFWFENNLLPTPSKNL